MQIACCQFDISWEDKPANYKQVETRARGADLPPGALFVLPEMFNTGYSMNAAAITEPIDGPTAAFLADLATRYAIYVIAGAAIAGPSGRPRNESLAFGPDGRLLARYAKTYPFSSAGEHQHFERGTEIVGFDWHGCRVVLTVCYDLRFPELYRRAAARGADLFTCIANWPVMRADHWVTLLRARAIENQAYVAGVNRSGRDPWLEYPGRSQIISPRGQVLDDAADADTVIRADVDLEALREYRKVFPPLADLRPELLTDAGLATR
jgi:omega-amidase